MEVLVIGCGVIGLSTAITLLKKGYKVKIIAKDLPPNTTSNKAAAVWYPYLAAPEHKIGTWARFTMDYLKEQAQNKDSGVILQKTVELCKQKVPEPSWTEHIPSFRAAAKDEMPEPYEHGNVVDGVVADTDMYMEYLVNEFKSLGGVLEQREIKNIDEVFATHDIIINCTGLGSRELLNDNELYPTRGQTVIVKNKKLAHSVMDDGIVDAADLVYVIPRNNTTVLGGTAQEGSWNLQPDPKDTHDILCKAAQLVPEFSDVEIVQIKVGLRPTRSSIRLEHEWHKGGKKLLIHNYGHGGSGFTLAWGCANDVHDILEQNISKFRPRSKL